jgi:hypothetical protein
MADISDITVYLKNAALAAVYPNGTSQPSVAAMDVRVIEGWPEPQLLDLDMAGKTLIGATGNIPIPRPVVFALPSACFRCCLRPRRRTKFRTTLSSSLRRSTG